MGCIDMVSVGQKVSFIPAWDEPGKDVHDVKQRRVRCGKVIYINEPNQWFMVQYTSRKGVKLRECFKFSAVGDGVSIDGK